MPVVLLLSALCFNSSLQALTQVFIPVPDVDSTTSTFDFGPTGLQIQLEPPNYTIRVKGVVAGSPAEGLVSVDDIIDSINGVSLSGSVDPRITLGDIITDAESTAGAGVLDLQVQGVGLVTINIPVLGDYSATWPVSCPKSDAIVDNLATLIASQATPDAGSIMFLLSTGDNSYLPVIENWIANKGSMGSYPWSSGMEGPGICEYYLQTGDPKALALIQEGANNLRDLMYAGGWSGRGHASITYGPGSGQLNAAGVPALTFLLMAKLCGADVDETTLQDSLENFYRYAGHDNVAYGNSVPEGGFRDNGKTSALAFAMQAATRLDPAGEDTVFAEARDISATKAFYANPWFNRGHPGGGIGEMWHAMAMGLMADVRPEQYRNYMDARRWHFELSRDHEGAMGICHTDSPSVSFDKSTGTGWDWGTFYALAYTMPRKNLILFGAPLTPYCKPYDLPERPWGTEADETFYSLRPAMQPNGDVTELSYERVGTHDSAAYGSLLSAADTSDVTLVEFAHHIDQGIRSDAAKNIVAKGRSSLLLPLLQSDEPRVRHAGLLTITGMFKGDSFALGDISAAAIQEVEDMLEDPDESLWVRIHAARALARFDAATIAAHKTTLLAMLDHDDWWVQEAAARSLKVIIAEEDHYLDVIPPMAEFSCGAQLVTTLWGYGWPGSDMMDRLENAASPIRDFAAQHFVQEHTNNPVFMQGPGGKVVTDGATYINNFVGQGADFLLGTDPYPRAMTLATPTARITLDPADQIDYDGQFIYDPTIDDRWEHVTTLSTPDSLGPVIDAGPGAGSSPDIIFNSDGTVDGDPGAVWTDGYYIDLFKREAREIIKAKHNGLYYLIIEKGTFDIGENPNQYWHPGYDVYVRKYADTAAPVPDPMTFALAPTGTAADTVSMTATTAIDGAYPVEYYFENTTNSDFRDWSIDPNWENTGLAAGTYSYQVKARDGDGNETAWSVAVDGSPGDDSTPPFPNTMAFERPPTATSATSITMTARTATDLNGVEYYFECTSDPTADSGWQDVPVYTPTGLSTGVSYTFVVRARDKSTAQNVTADSGPASATPQAVTDMTPPLVAVLEPVTGANGIAPSASLVMTFDEEVIAGTGSIIVKNLTEGIETPIAINDGQIVISGTTVTITPTGGLIEGRTYAVRIAEGVFTDSAANAFAGLLNDNAWRFTVADSNPPLVQSLSPADETTEVSPTSDLRITFDEPVAVGTGKVTIKNLDDITQTQIDITDGSRVTVTGSTLIINPVNTLEFGKRFAVQVDASAIDDLAGNSFAGITDDTTWNFDTWANAVLTKDNPLVPTVIGVGETFQVAFVTNAVLQRDLLDGADDGSDDSVISQWNAWVNDQAAASGHPTAAGDIAELSWNAIASTTLVAARDNALVSGPVYRIDRNPVATGFADMWDASLINAIEVDENGLLQSGYVWSGSSSDGNITGSHPLGNGTEGALRGIIGTGGSWFTNGAHLRRGPDDTSTRVYALSEVITVAADATPPAISTLTPADDSTGVAVGTDLKLKFNETISSGSGNIVLKNLTDITQTTIAITDGTQVSIEGSTLTINPTSDLLQDKNYAIQIDNGAIEDTSGNAFAGISDDATWNFDTVPAPDTSPPSIVALSPADDSVSVAVDTDLVVTFDENIVAGTGNVTIKNLSDATEVTIDINDGTQVTISGNTLTINPAADLLNDRNHSIFIDAGAIEDSLGHAFAGITVNWMWSFETLDPSAPRLVSVSPPDDSQYNSVGIDLILTFDEYILPGTGLITLKNLTDATESTIDISDESQVTFLGNSVEINPASGLALHKEYAIQIASGAIEDQSGNDFPGITDDITWNFDTFDNVPPSIIALSPHNTDSVPVDTDLVATFDETIVAGTGDITVKNLTDATEIMIDVTDGNQVSIAGSTLTIDPTADLETDKSYAIQIATTAIVDTFGNGFAGIAGDIGWSFTTVLTPKFLDYKHPMVPSGFGPGDTIQFAFVTSAQIERDLLDGSDDGSDDSVIYNWNTWVNDQADASTHPTAASEIARFHWYAIASTKDVAARDNALVSGPVYRLDGGLVANDFTDMWDGSLSSAIGIDENGGTQSGYLWSGSSSGGTSSSQPLGDGTDNATRGSIGTGGNWFASGGYLSRGPNYSERVYALSEVITLVDSAPAISTLSPADGATAVAVGADLVVTFDVSISSGSGNIVLKNLTDASEVTIAITDGSQVTISGSTLTINPANDLLEGKNYAIRIAGTAIEGNAGNAFAGISDDTTWDFSTAVPTFSTWIGGFSGLGGLTTFGDDPDGDGHKNGIEYFFGTHPGEASRGLSAGAITVDGDTSFTFTHPLNPSPADNISAAYRWSKDLLSFHYDGDTFENTTVTFSDPSSPDAEGIVSVTATITGTAVERIFIDVEVTQD